MLSFEFFHIHTLKEIFRLCQTVVSKVLALLDDFGEPLDDEEDVIVVLGQVALLQDDVVLQINIEMNIISKELYLRLVIVKIEQISLTNGILRS